MPKIEDWSLVTGYGVTGYGVTESRRRLRQSRSRFRLRHAQGIRSDEISCLVAIDKSKIDELLVLVPKQSCAEIIGLPRFGGKMRKADQMSKLPRLWVCTHVVLSRLHGH